MSHGPCGLTGAEPGCAVIALTIIIASVAATASRAAKWILDVMSVPLVPMGRNFAVLMICRTGVILDAKFRRCRPDLQVRRGVESTRRPSGTDCAPQIPPGASTDRSVSDGSRDRGGRGGPGSATRLPRPGSALAALRCAR